MPTNKEVIEKATITTDALASAGKLSDEQADKFLDYVFDETSIKGLGIRMEKFRAEKKSIEKINVANRVAVPADEAADPGIRRGVSTSKIELEPKDIMVPFEVGDLFKRRNIEGDGGENHVIKMMATRLANNVEELWLDGNALGPAVTESDLVEGGSSTLVRKDRYLGLFDGWLKRAEAGHVVDGGNAQLSPSLVAKTFRALPNKFRKNKAAMRLVMSPDHEMHYAEGVAARMTSAGDAALGGGQAPSFGVKFHGAPLLDSEPLYVEHVVANSDGSTATALAYGPVTEIVVTPTTVDKSPIAAYVLGVDYSEDLAAGTITRLGGGSIPSGGTVKVTYRTAGRMFYTMPSNMIIAISLDIAIEKQRNIYTRVNEFAIHASAFCTFEEIDAVAFLKNVEVPNG